MEGSTQATEIIIISCTNLVHSAKFKYIKKLYGQNTPINTGSIVQKKLHMIQQPLLKINFNCAVSATEDDAINNKMKNQNP